MSIRIRVILPYLLLTILVAITGAYVVTRLVTDSLSERLNNQLLQAGRVVSDEVARQEINHIENARIIIFTRGVAEALIDADSSTLHDLALPIASGIGVENLFIINLQGQEMLHLVRVDETLLDVTKPFKESAFNFIQKNLFQVA